MRTAGACRRSSPRRRVDRLAVLDPLPSASGRERVEFDFAEGVVLWRRMKLVARYLEYAEAFECTFVDDDWSRLEQYFTDDASYSTPTNGLLVSGRDSLLAVLRASVSSFERLCDSHTLITDRRTRRRWGGSSTGMGGDVYPGGRTRHPHRRKRACRISQRSHRAPRSDDSPRRAVATHGIRRGAPARAMTSPPGSR